MNCQRLLQKMLYLDLTRYAWLNFQLTSVKTSMMIQMTLMHIQQNVSIKLYHGVKYTLIFAAGLMIAALFMLMQMQKIAEILVLVGIMHFCGTDGLQKALDYISKSSCSSAYSIYVASGTYYPGTEEEDSFVIPDNTELYGGFPKGGCDFEDRNTKKYQPILTGQIDDDSDHDINSVVTMGG